MPDRSQVGRSSPESPVPVVAGEGKGAKRITYPDAQCPKPLCRYQAEQLDRAMAENLELRAATADGPRARVRELEGLLAAANGRIGELQRRLHR